MGSGHRAYDVKRIIDIGHPVTHGLVEGVFERRRAGGHTADLGTQQTHLEHIDGLAVDIYITHVNPAGLVQTCGNRRGRDPVLTRPGLGDNTLLAHVVGQQTLAHGVVDFMCTGMIQIFSF